MELSVAVPLVERELEAHTEAFAVAVIAALAESSPKPPIDDVAEVVEEVEGVGRTLPLLLPLPVAHIETLPITERVGVGADEALSLRSAVGVGKAPERVAKIDLDGGEEGERAVEMVALNAVGLCETEAQEDSVRLGRGEPEAAPLREGEADIVTEREVEGEGLAVRVATPVPLEPNVEDHVPELLVLRPPLEVPEPAGGVADIEGVGQALTEAAATVPVAVPDAPGGAVVAAAALAAALLLNEGPTEALSQGDAVALDETEEDCDGDAEGLLHTLGEPEALTLPLTQTVLVPLPVGSEESEALSQLRAVRVTRTGVALASGLRDSEEWGDGEMLPDGHREGVEEGLGDGVPLPERDAQTLVLGAPTEPLGERLALFCAEALPLPMRRPVPVPLRQGRLECVGDRVADVEEEEDGEGDREGGCVGVKTAEPVAPLRSEGVVVLEVEAEGQGGAPVRVGRTPVSVPRMVTEGDDVGERDVE